ncbi:MAG: ATP synthase subunit I [Deltaproteobacteria bacterium]|nr:ATP synthase subunit I [Deltaproteobacteria bacterium]MDH3800798.1 ATP synthase subunit I [Deltaproteobacteria bacterium]MDH3850305.1 ATP synthase subunit I [Deltaproteobacteria bacterium]MDH3928139.1 ATP synthase subunit I [Deltaproteobacteria bacterium]MDH3950883.1 ATP synthase subunit I [Deltaproteobacteria bacterium]
MRVISGPVTMLIKDEALLNRLEQFNWVLLALLASGSFVFFSRKFALGVLAGGILAVANYYLVKRSLRRALDPERQGKTRFLYLLKYGLRFAALGLIIALLLIKGWVSPLGMLLGLSIIVLGIALVGVVEARKLFFKGVV